MVRSGIYCHCMGMVPLATFVVDVALPAVAFSHLARTLNLLCSEMHFYNVDLSILWG